MNSSVNNTSSIKGNVNFYNVDPFKNEFHPQSDWLPEGSDEISVIRQPYVKSDDEEECNPCKLKCYDKEACIALF